MADVYSSSQWQVIEGHEADFVDSWRRALTWTQEAYGDALERARLLQDARNGSHFVSFIEWGDERARERWLSDEGYRDHMTTLRGHCREADPSSYSEAAKVG